MARRTARSAAAPGEAAATTSVPEGFTTGDPKLDALIDQFFETFDLERELIYDALRRRAAVTPGGALTIDIVLSVLNRFLTRDRLAGGLRKVGAGILQLFTEGKSATTPSSVTVA